MGSAIIYLVAIVGLIAVAQHDNNLVASVVVGFLLWKIYERIMGE